MDKQNVDKQRGKQYITADMYLVAFIRLCGIEPVEVLPGKIVRWVFEHTKELENAVGEYYNLRMPEYVQALLSTKSELFVHKRK